MVLARPSSQVPRDAADKLIFEEESKEKAKKEAKLAEERAEKEKAKKGKVFGNVGGAAKPPAPPSKEVAAGAGSAEAVGGTSGDEER